MEGKPELRRRTIAERDRLPAHEIRRRSAAASSRLLALPEFHRARTVMFFVTFGSEAETLPSMQAAISQGKRVSAPRADPRTRSLEPCQIADLDADLVPGAHNIREPRPHCRPVPLDQIEVVIVPAAVWGEDGYRIGYGGGYYDRFLERLPSATSIGFGFEMQVVSEVPHSDDDRPVDILVTDARVRRFTRARGTHEGAESR
jgi:5-formyltetrahydrofolate cyclo-ligase